MFRNRFLALITALCLLVSVFPFHTHAAHEDRLEDLYQSRHQWEATHEIRTDSRGQRIIAPKSQSVLPAGRSGYLVSDTLGDNCQWGITSDGFLYIWGDGPMPVCELGQYPWNAHKSLFYSAYIDCGSVADNAFADHGNLEMVILEGSVTAIGQNAFALCTGMYEFWFYGAAPTIADNAFNGTLTYLLYHYNDASFEPLVGLDFGGELSWSTWVDVIDSGMFGSVEWTVTEDMTLYLHGVYGPMQDMSSAAYPWHAWSDRIDYVFCEGITHLGNHALENFSVLEYVSFDHILTSIGDGAFQGCSDFTLTFIGSAPSLGTEVFSTDAFTLNYPEDEASWTQEVINLFYGRESSDEDELPPDDLPSVEIPGEITCGTSAQQIHDAMIALKAQYPEGMRWTNDDYYAWNGGDFSGGYGCAGFAFILSDAAFGHLPSRRITENITIDDIRVGDILRINNDTHSVIVLEVHADHVVVAEGNYNSSIHWGRTFSAQAIADVTDYVMTRYPAHTWNAGSCLDPRTCSVCGTQAEAPGHSWKDAFCTAPKTCTVCGFTEGAPAGHRYDNDQDATCNVCGAQRDVGTTPPVQSEIPLSDFELEVLRLTNLERLAQGLNPLTATALLQEAADIRASEIATYFDHTRPNGTKWHTVLEELDILYAGAAENIACGFRTPASVMTGWMNSEGHKANILTDHMGHLGVGELSYNWVQLFTTAPAYSAIRVDIPEGTVIQPGTTIDEMGLVAVLQNSNGDCWLPLTSAYCSGYDPNKGGAQTVTVNVLGVSCSFTLNAEGHTHTWVEATCESPATCSTCGKAEGAPLGHDWQNATCEAPKTCAVCGKTDGSALGHNWQNATCENPKTCAVCGKTEGRALGHNWQNATCEAPKTCAVCGKTEGSALGHDWAGASCEAPATCHRCGVSTGTAVGHNWQEADCDHAKICTVCGKTEGSALGHDWQNATCENPKTCAVCGKTDGSALGHDWAGASCEAPATCHRCGVSTGTAVGHNWQEADCEHAKICTVCGKTEGSALGHDWQNATCENPKTCAVCGKTDGNALGHNWQNATCETPKTCSVCGKTEGSALGHNWQNATCETPKTCVTCGTTEGQPLGHDWAEADCLIPSTCRNCSEIQGEPLGHDWIPATCQTRKTCSRCSATEGTLAPHTFQGGYCTLCGTSKRALGDATGDGKVTYEDALKILRASIALEPITDDMLQFCDVDDNGRLDYNDALLILRYSINLITEFPKKI